MSEPGAVKQILSTAGEPKPVSQAARLMSHLREPLYRNGYALIFSAILTSGLGMVYWMVAARSYSTEVVGINSAWLSAINFLANLSQLNLMNALTRFIPRAGKATPRLIFAAYGISAVMSFLTTFVFILGIHLWSPDLGFIQASLPLALWMAISVAAWCVFVQQDSVLTGLRQAVWVPAENLVFAIAKIAMLLLLAAPLPLYGMVFSWTIPLVLIILPVNLLIFRYLMPAHIQQSQQQADLPGRKDLLQYISGDYLSSLMWTALHSLFPLFVLHQLGATANAYYYLALTIAYSLYLVGGNMGMSLVAEAATHPTRLEPYSYRALLQSLRLLIPVVLLVIIFAPLLLTFFGKGYAEDGVSILRWLCLSAIPYAVNVIYINILRAQQQTGRVFWIYASISILVVGISLLLIETQGLTGIGIAWLVAQSLVALFLMLSRLGKFWLPQFNTHRLLKWLAVPRRWVWQWQQRSKVEAAKKLLPSILPTVRVSGENPISWSILSVVETANDVVVLCLGETGQLPAALLKVPQSPESVSTMLHQQQILEELRHDSRLPDWTKLLPEILAQGTVQGQYYVVEKMIPGQDARRLMTVPALKPVVAVSAMTAITELHRLTAHSVTVDANLLERWIDEPLQTLRQHLTPTPAHLAKLEKLRRELYQALEGQTVTLARIHGDFWAGNMLAAPDGTRLTGIIDWELAQKDDLPLFDRIQFLLANRTLLQDKELGDVLDDLFEAGRWYSEEQALLDDAAGVVADEITDFRTLLFLAWLRHTADNLTKSTRYAAHWLWMTKNVEAVIRHI